MPQQNGTGPAGQGPLTGRGMGPCSDNAPKAGKLGLGLGLGRGRGRGFRWFWQKPKQDQQDQPDQGKNN